MVSKAHQRANAIHHAFVSSVLVRAYLSELFLCTSDRLWNIIQLCGRHILSKTSKQSKVYKDDLLEDFLGLRNFYMQRLEDLND